MGLSNLAVRLFADGADKELMLRLADDPLITGFTTNPTLMRRAGVTSYETFAREVLEVIRDRPISFEVVSDEFPEMEREARLLASWGKNVCVKIPITNTRGDPSTQLVRALVADGLHVNVTAVMTPRQVRDALASLEGCRLGWISIFAGRIADTGRDPVPIVREAVELAATVSPAIEIVWASPRELLNIFQADTIGCQIVTLTSDLLAKLHILGKDLTEYSLETVNMFATDARAAGLALEAPLTAAAVG